MKSLLRAVQCTESLQMSSLLDRRHPSKVSMIEKMEGAGWTENVSKLARAGYYISNQDGYSRVCTCLHAIHMMWKDVE
jgi:hypothetical protein